MSKNLFFVIFGLYVCVFSLTISAAPVAGETTTAAAEEIAVSSVACEVPGDCSYHGICDVERGVCVCNSGYAEADCSYKEKKQLAAFLLHIFLGMEFGAGHFYAGNDGMGAGELVLFWASAILTGCGVSYEKSPAALVGALGLLGSFGWWIADAVRFGQNKIDDGNGKPLEDW